MEERFGPIGNDRYRALPQGHPRLRRASDVAHQRPARPLQDRGRQARAHLRQASRSTTSPSNASPSCSRRRTASASSSAPRCRRRCPQIVADARSVRQIVLNLLSNSIKFTGAGGQVIVSTALTDDGEVVLRVRDTGIGMSEKDLETALEPFRQIATSARGRLGRHRARPAADQGAGGGQPREIPHQERAECRHLGRDRLSRRCGYWLDNGVPCAQGQYCNRAGNWLVWLRNP